MWLYHRRGGNGIKLTSSDDLNSAAGPVASPDGRFIYFSAREARFSYQPKLAGGLWDIYRFDRTTGEQSQITSGIGGATRPALSPDGKTLVFVSRRDAVSVLVARTLATGAERVLARNVERDDQEGFTAMDVWPNYAFLPDGSAIVYSSHGKLQRLALAANAQPVEIPFRASVEQWLAPDGDLAGARRIRTGRRRRFCGAPRSRRTANGSSSRRSAGAGCSVSTTASRPARRDG